MAPSAGRNRQAAPHFGTLIGAPSSSCEVGAGPTLMSSDAQGGALVDRPTDDACYPKALRTAVIVGSDDDLPMIVGVVKRLDLDPLPGD
jgi:hypothetical protein